MPTRIGKHRSGSPRRGDYAADQSDRPGASLRPAGRTRRDHRRRFRHSDRRRCSAGARRDLSGTANWLRLGWLPASVFIRPRISVRSETPVWLRRTMIASPTASACCATTAASASTEHAIVGQTARLDNLQAAVLRVQADYLESWNQRRRQVAAWYRELLPPGIVSPSKDWQRASLITCLSSA